jgi:hypothetical protein
VTPRARLRRVALELAHGGLGGGWRPGTEHRAPGHDPLGRSYGSYASFRDPDGNKWLLQEIGERLPGRI